MRRRPLPLAALALLLTPALATAQTASPVGGGPSDVTIAADAWMAAHHASPGVTFARRAVLSVASGTVVRYVEQVRGVIVRDDGAAVLVDANGAVIAENDFTLRTPLPNTVAAIGPADAAARARARIGGTDPGDDGARTVLVWTHEFGTPRLVYEVDTAPLAETLADAPRVLVDARTGDIVWRTNRACTATGRVFPRDPQTTPAMTERTLGGLSDESTLLHGVEVESFNCIDRHAHVDSADQGAVHVCSAEHTAVADVPGHFVAAFTSPTDPSDGYSELAAYAYASEQLAFVHTLGFGTMREHPLRTVSNVRLALLDVDPTLAEDPLGAWDNAAFVPGDLPGALAAAYGHGHDVVLIGQGALVDLAHDADVVSHETGHAVVAHTADFGEWRTDAYGLDRSPRTLNEALADYFVAARTGDPRIARYAANDFEGGSLRALDGTMPWGRAMRGEEHLDSVPFSSALWSAREAAGPGFDRAVYEALAMAPTDPSADGLAALVVSATKRTMDGDAGLRVEGVFAARALDVPQPRLFDVPMRAGDDVQVPGTDAGQGDMVPGTVQFRWPNAQGTSRLRVSFDVNSAQVMSLRLYVRAGAPVQFAYDDGVAVTADHDAIVTTRNGHAVAQFTFDAPVDGQTLYFATATTEGPTSWIRGFTIDALDPVSGDVRTNTLAVDAPRASETAAPVQTAGCSAGRVDGRTASSAWPLVALVAVVSRRRRSAIVVA